MALETASYVANLVATNPDGGDARSTADDHLRLIKAALTRTFPKLDAAVSASSAQIAYLYDVSASIQSQLNLLRDGSATAANAVNARFANSASLALYANSASYAALAATANSASYAALAGQAASASFATLARTANSASYATLAGTATSASFATNAAHARSASFATVAATATTATTASTATSASSAALLGGFPGATGATADTVAIRNSSGHLSVVRVIQISSDSENVSVGQFVTLANGDNFFRKSTPSHVGQYLETRNISSRTGTNKTLSTSTPSGGSNGDIWYRY